MASKSSPVRDWSKLLEEYRGGDESQEDFCRRRRINIWTFRSRLYKTRRKKAAGQRRKREQAVQFIEVKPQHAALSSVRCQITLGAATVELENVPPVEWVLALVGSYRG